MTHGDNPAARVRWFLIQLGQAREWDTTVAEVAWEILRVPQDPLALLPPLLDIVTQTRLTRVALDALPPDVDQGSVPKRFEEVENAVNYLHLPYTVNVSQVLGPMTGQGWHALEVASEVLLHKYAREAVIPDDKLSDLQMRTQSLLRDVEKSTDIDDEAKIWLTDRLREILRALYRLQVVGHEAVDSAFSGLVGSAVRSPGIFTRIKDSKFGPAFLGVVTALSAMAGTAVSVKELTSGPPDTAQVQVVVQQIMELPAAPAAIDDTRRN